MPLNMNFSFNDAHRIINNVIDERLNKLTRSGAGIDITWGTVESYATPYECSVYVLNDTVPTPGFRVNNGLIPDVGDPVRVAIDKRGNKWIEAVEQDSTSAFNKLEIDPRDGEIRFGGGTAAPDVTLKWGAANRLDLGDGDSLVIMRGAAWLFGDTSSNDVLNVAVDTDGIFRFSLTAAGVMSWGDGTNTHDVKLYRDEPNILATDDRLELRSGAVSEITLGLRRDVYSVTQSRKADNSAYTDFVLRANDFVFEGGTTGSVTERLRIRDDGVTIIGRDGAGSDTLQLTGGTPGNGLIIGGDVNLFRAGSNQLKTDDVFIIGRDGAGSDSLILLGTTAGNGLVIGGDTNLFRAYANGLKTDDAFNVGGSLTIESNGMIRLREITGFGPNANECFIYARDNGSGKTQLIAHFSAGAVQILATEP